MKYKINNTVRNLSRIDILIYFYYCLNVSKKKGKINRIKISNIITYLSRYDYNYIDLDPLKIRNEIKRLFPIRKNNHKKTKNFKISNILILYWGKKFNIIYEQHKEIYSTFKKIDDGTLPF